MDFIWNVRPSLEAEDEEEKKRAREVGLSCHRTRTILVDRERNEMYSRSKDVSLD